MDFDKMNGLVPAIIQDADTAKVLMLGFMNMGLITRRFFKTYRRHAIVILLILAAFITPSSDPFTLSVVFVPLYALYELSAWVVKPASQKDDGNSEEDSNEILDEH